MSKPKAPPRQTLTRPPDGHTVMPRDEGNGHLRPTWHRSLALLLLTVGAALAHSPEGLAVEAFQFADDLVPTVDGRLGDWAIAGPGLTAESFVDLVAAAPVDAQDFEVHVWVGWNESANRLYVAAEVVDDIHQVDRPDGSAATRIFQDDDMEVFVDADHSGGQFADFSDLSNAEQLARNGTEASHFVLAGPHRDGEFFVGFSAAAWYALDDGPYTQGALTFDGTPGGRGVTRYEMAIVPFDRINVTADFLSRGHDLREGEKIGFNLEFSDFDSRTDLLDAKWSLSGGQNAFRLSERFADLVLMPLDDRFRPTGIEKVSWGRIKASFAH